MCHISVTSCAYIQLGIQSVYVNQKSLVYYANTVIMLTSIFYIYITYIFIAVIICAVLFCTYTCARYVRGWNVSKTQQLAQLSAFLFGLLSFDFCDVCWNFKLILHSTVLFCFSLPTSRPPVNAGERFCQDLVNYGNMLNTYGPVKKILSPNYLQQRRCFTLTGVEVVYVIQKGCSVCNIEQRYCPVFEFLKILKF